jgi:hypothetical protein
MKSHSEQSDTQLKELNAKLEIAIAELEGNRVREATIRNREEQLNLAFIRQEG